MQGLLGLGRGAELHHRLLPHAVIVAGLLFGKPPYL